MPSKDGKHNDLEHLKIERSGVRIREASIFKYNFSRLASLAS
ncbi:hypothetical protein LINGRAHAP2_LOCUS7599, partial [Linum grandiflorum]